MSKSETWNASVARGRTLVTEIGRNKWELGDLANEVCPAGDTKANDGGRLEKFAAEIGINTETLREYRRVAKAWPHATRVACATWTTHRDVAGRDDRFGIIAEQEWTYNSLQERLGRLPNPSRVTPDTEEFVDHEELVDWIRTGIKDDADIAREARKALDERYEDAPKPVTVPEHPQSNPVELVYKFRQLHKSVDSIISLVIGGKAVVSDTEREAVLREVQWLRTALGYIEDGVAANSLDKALAEMLSAES